MARANSLFAAEYATILRSSGIRTRCTVENLMYFLAQLEKEGSQGKMGMIVRSMRQMHLEL
eukprot:2146644-Amphidinium_carterae.2